MGLFSFGKKDDSGRDAYSDSSRGSRHTVRTERRTRRSERTDADAMMLDPTLPEKQRARRRLVGAIALVLAAVIVLPMVLDSRPKPVTDDISIDIPNRPAPAAKQSRDANDADTQAGVAHDAPSGASGSASAGVTQPQAAAPAATAKPEPKPEAKPDAKAEAKPEAKPSKPAAVASQNAKPQAAEPSEQANANTAANAAAGAANTPSSPAGSRFVLQIGQFDDETAAQNWVNKLKSAGVPAYLEHRKQSDGATKSLLRAGPFPDRASAQAALVKVRQAGLGGGTRASN
ncbi:MULTISPECIES: SPOR domain-containing protein [Caballeronia]|uniref:Sporulation protein n=1 Tax=Caballeronia zhejiangensis TaxID=871203 RepID=A0A656QPD7_9BURK|nr:MULTISPECIES: SPOR domain-containing protein [Caballeronia]EKS67145.1 sporulation domain-containing protein [Burkholderia sp. SJ98]KDR30319.1 sporulation protein [Caballeronia zhejiangensis]MDR5789574.1 SPOR domain-containing protein [Caballeronia sp. LP003]